MVRTSTLEYGEMGVCNVKRASSRRSIGWQQVIYFMLLLCYFVNWPNESVVGVRDPFSFVATEPVVFGG